mmetsp:Transcript_9986/g.14396  ORF Transcript_9986/g.14396 Transcript_9986/m.14396 type:complete len:94 (+) Transcript_9986:2912-3193(+)
MIVLPSLTAKLSNILISAWAVVLSSPDVGSSRRTMMGSVSSSVPMLTRFRSPPERRKMGVSAQEVRRSTLIMRSTSSILRNLVHSDGRRRKAV